MDDVPTLRVKAILDNVPLAIDFVARSAQAAQVDNLALYEIQVAVDEACANVVCHAYADQEPGDMEVSCAVDGPEFVIRVRDWGASFDPDAVEAPDLTAPLEKRQLGGLGLYLLKHYMDSVQFTFDPERGNELILIKRLHGAPQGVQAG